MTGTSLSGASHAPSGGGLLFPLIGGALDISAAILLAAAGIGTRLGFWPFRFGFDLLRYGVYCGCAAFLVAITAALLSCSSGNRKGLLLALLAAITASIIIAVPVAWKLSAQRLPSIHDISTDITNPPAFLAVLALRKDVPNSAAYGGVEVAALQRKGYPDIKTIVLDIPQTVAFEKALNAARVMGWQIVAAVPAEGRIEATDTTFWFGFKDDIVIRVVPAGNRSLVDIRSVSRVGVSDVGTNARRIRFFMKKLS